MPNHAGPAMTSAEQNSKPMPGRGVASQSDIFGGAGGSRKRAAGLPATR